MDAENRGTTYPILAVVAIAGAGTMTVELAAVRLLAPWFGTSSGVWTNVIGVILLALAIGYLLGARLSRGGRPDARLGVALLVSAAFTGWLPALAQPVAETFLPRGLALDEAAGLLAWGSLAAAVVLFLPAALVLGCIGPLAVEWVQRRRGLGAGEAGGRVLAASTIGSLAGTFGTTHLFLPVVGLDGTFLSAAGVLALLGVAVLVVARSRSATAVVALVAASAALGFSRTGSPEVGEGLRLLRERQSRYQSLRVVEEEEREIRWLQVNESFDSFQSLWQPDTGLFETPYYYNYFAPPAWWSGVRSDWRTLILGLGAGTTVRVLEGALPPEARLVSVGAEIDADVIALGVEYFDLPVGPDRIALGGLDARAALRLAEGPFDQIVLDTYANNMEIPAHLSTREFFTEVRDALAPGGWLSVNAAGFGLDDPVVEAVARTVAVAFDASVLAVRVPFSRNCMLYARAGESVPEPGSGDWSIADRVVGALLPPLEIDGAWRWFDPRDEGPVLTDDWNPIDRLQLESIAGGRARWVESL